MDAGGLARLPATAQEAPPAPAHQRRLPDGHRSTICCSRAPDERERQAAALRSACRNCTSNFNIRFPIYVLITKADLLAGFMEFFGDLGSEDRAQVWEIVSVWRDGRSRVPRREASRPNLRRSNISSTPVWSIACSKNAIPNGAPCSISSPSNSPASDRRSTTSSTRYSRPPASRTPLLRGVYLTSGTQEGNPIDRVMGTLGRAFRLERKLLEPLVPSGSSFLYYPPPPRSDLPRSRPGRHQPQVGALTPAVAMGRLRGNRPGHAGAHRHLVHELQQQRLCPGGGSQGAGGQGTGRCAAHGHDDHVVSLLPVPVQAVRDLSAASGHDQRHSAAVDGLRPVSGRQAGIGLQ